MDKVLHEVAKFGGVVTDIPAAELMMEPVWTGGSNVHFDDRGTHRSGGARRFADPPSGSPIFIHPVLTPEVAYWIYVTKDAGVWAIYVTDGTNHFDITPVGGVSGGEPGEWTGTDLNGLPVLNNFKDAPIWWDGSTSNPMQTLPGWPVNTVCKSVRAYRYHLFAFNIIQDGVHTPEKLLWSESADPGLVPQSWDALPENDAGDNILAATIGGIVDALPLRDHLVIYKQHSTYLCQYVAGQYVFGFRKLFVTSGIQSTNCVVEMKGHHVVFTDDDVIIHDGQKFQSVIDQKMRKHLLSGINPDNQPVCQVVGRNDTDEVWVIAPAVDGLLQSVALVYSFNEGHFGIRPLDDSAYVANGIVPDESPDPTWEGATTVWQEDPRYWNEATYSITNDTLVKAMPNTQALLNVDASNDNDGQDVEASVVKEMHLPGGMDMLFINKLFRSIYPRFTGQSGQVITCRVGSQQTMGEPIRWGDPVDIEIGVTTKVDTLLHGRFLSMRFESTGGAPWQLHTIGIEYVPLAKY